MTDLLATAIIAAISGLNVWDWQARRCASRAENAFQDAETRAELQYW